MSELNTLLEEALEAWEYAREGVIAEAGSVPADRFDFRPAPESRSVAELVVHIIESGEMMAGELSRPDGDFTRQSYADHVREHAGRIPADQPKEALLALLRRTGEGGRRRIREAGEIAMLQRIRRFDGLEGTRLAWMNHGIDHEMYHCGQLALYVRLLGRVPALTRRIRGES
ncbi:MAG: DinB family protein [Gemmatimonadetes bacterium]|nr:DinB family protein [Gemmatimonadota bacterium]